MVKKLLPCLALICTLSLTSALSAQDDAKEAEKPKAKQVDKKEKAKQKKVSQISQRVLRDLKGVELTEDQTKKLSELVEAKLDTIKDLQKQGNNLVNKEDRKTISKELKKARTDGKPWAEATKAAWDKVGISKEDQTKLKDINKQRNDLFAQIQSDLTATFSEDQKKAMNATKKKGKGKGKGKKGKKKKKEAEGDNTSVSVSLPGMT